MGRSAAMGGVGHFLFFCIIQLVIYADRTVFNGLVETIERSFGMTSTQGGLCGSGFIGGFMSMAPLAGLLGHGRRGPVIIGVGLFLWTASVITTCFAPNYPVLLASRIVAGVGEAAYSPLALPMIDDSASPKQKALFGGLFFATIFIGSAVGFGLQAPFSTWKHARWIFFVEGVVMVPFSAFAVVCRNRFHRGVAETAEHTLLAAADGISPENEPAPPSASRQVAMLFSSPVYVSLMLGYCATIFSIGGLAFWAPSIITSVLGVNKTTGGLALAVMTGASGVFGSLAGGVSLDIVKICLGGEERLLRSILVALVCSVIALPTLVGMALLDQPVLWFSSAGISQVFMFMASYPANLGMMEAVPPQARGLSLGVATLMSHALGDLIPPVLIGMLVDRTHTLRPGMLILALWGIWPILLWSVAFCIARSRRSDHSCTE